MTEAIFSKFLDLTFGPLWNSLFFWRFIGISSILISIIIVLFWKYLKEMFIKSKSIIDIPEQTIRIVRKPSEGFCWWSMGSSGDKPIMQICGDFFVTNLTQYNILLTSAKLKGISSLGVAGLHGGDTLLPTATNEVRVHFLVMPPFKKSKEDFEIDLAVIDQFGNEHWIKKVRFKGQ